MVETSEKIWADAENESEWLAEMLEALRAITLDTFPAMKWDTADYYAKTVIMVPGWA